MIRLFKIVFPIFILLSTAYIYNLSIYISLESREWKDLKDRKQIYFRIDSEFNSIERKQIKEAFRQWESKTGKNVKLHALIGDTIITEMFSWQSDELPTIYKASSWWNWKNHVGVRMAQSSAYGVAAIFSGDIFILCKGSILKDVVIHEVGHVLINAMWHSSNKKSIMYPVIENPNRALIQQEEIDIIKQVK